jgi:hypothetical protein
MRIVDAADSDPMKSSLFWQRLSPSPNVGAVNWAQLIAVEPDGLAPFLASESRISRNAHVMCITEGFPKTIVA